MVINRKVLPWLIAGVALAAILLIVLVMVTQAAPDSAPHRQSASISPGVVSYQGQVNIGGVPFSGTGYFRFAIVDSGGTVYWSSDSIAPSEYFTECSDWMNYDIGPAGAGNHLWGDVHVFSPTSPYGIHGLVSEIRNVMVVSGSTYINFSTACTGLSDGGNHVWGGNIAEPNGACGDDDNAGCVAIGLTRGHTFNYTTTIEFTCGGDYGYVLNGGIHGSGDETSFDSRVCLIHETDPGPTAAVTLTVVNGLFNALLGETNPITYGMFSDSDRWLRVWFDDGTHGVQLLEPDTRITTAPFAFRSDYAMTALTATYATTADSATTALTATWSTTATYATTADSSTTALTATNATTATYATTALTATNATTATYATTALTATNATTATYATTALTATNATTATYATTALTATNATTATYASTVPGFIIVQLATPVIAINVATFSTVATSTEITNTTLGIPASAKGILYDITVVDPGIAGQYFRFGPSATYFYQTTVTTLVTNQPTRDNGISFTDSNGSIWYRSLASGSNTLTVYMRVWGYLK